MTTHDLKSIVSFPFEDTEWLPKLGLYVLLMFGGILFIPALFASGYIYEIKRRMIVDKAAPSLPDWQNWDVLLLNGVKVAAVSIIYMLPAGIILFAGYFGPLILMPFTIAAGEDSPLVPLLAMPMMWVGIGLGMLLAFVTGLFLTVATDNMIAKGEFAAAFHFRDIWGVFRNNVAGYLLAYAIILGLTMAVSFVYQILVMTVILCCLAIPLMLILSSYVSLVSSVLFAQQYIDGVQCVASHPDDRLLPTGGGDHTINFGM